MTYTSITREFTGTGKFYAVLLEPREVFQVNSI